MISRLFDCCLGQLTLTADDDALVKVRWGNHLAGHGEHRDGRSSEHQTLDHAARQFEEYLSGRRLGFDLKIDLRGTPYRTRVWRRMKRIPYGKTKTYGGLATSLGSSPRAVGGACSANEMAIIIPCHRVLGCDNIGLYFECVGLDTKCRLLALEKATWNKQQSQSKRRR